MSKLTSSMSFQSSITVGSVRITGSRLYSLYTLFILMIIYLMSQTDRFVLGITSFQVSRDLEIGHMTCHRNETDDKGCGDNNCSLYDTDSHRCRNDVQCVWDYTATSIYYQILAGPSFLVTFAFFSLLMGLVASLPKVKRTMLLSVCSLVWSIITGLSGFTNQYWQLLLTRIGLGVFQAACTPLAGSIMSDIFSERSRGAALGFYSWGVYIGYSLAFAFNFVAKDLGWRWVFWIVSIPGIAISVLSLLTVREPVRLVPTVQEDTKIYKKSYSSLFRRVISSYMQLPLLLLCIGAGLRQGGGLVWAYNAKAFFRQLHCDGGGVGTYLSWVPVVGGSVGVFIGGWLSDGLVRRWGMKARIVVLVTCTFLASPFLFGTLYLSPPWAFLSLLLAFVTGEMWFGVCIAIAIEMVPSDISSTSLALYLFFVNIIGGNTNLALPPLQRSIGLRPAMIILFPGTYILAGVLFSVVGLLWVCRSGRCRSGKGRRGAGERSPLIQAEDDQLDSLVLTESMEIERRLSKRKFKGNDASFGSSIKSGLSFTASI